MPLAPLLVVADVGPHHARLGDRSKPAKSWDMASDDILALNNYGLTERSRTTASGAVKKRYTVEVRAEPLVHNLDPKALGKGPADAIAKFFRDSIAGIGATASAATLRARAAARKAGAASWASRRYAGGKLGKMEPGQTDKLFHDSGRMIRSIVASATSAGAYVVNVAANRFNPDTLDNGGTAALLRIFQQLRQYVPQLGDAAALAEALPVQRALRAASAAMLKKLDAAYSKSALEVAQQVLEIGNEAGELGETLAAEG